MPSIDTIIRRCPHNVPQCYLKRAIQIDQQLQSGVSYQSLYGVRVRCAPSMIRFKLGREWRLIYSQKKNHLEAICLTSRQNFERQIKQR